MSAHTPGPWNVERPYGESGVYVAAPSTALIAKVYPVDREWVVDQPTSIAANARLIAAAPEMLEALEQLVTAVEDSVADPIGLGIAASDAHEAIRKAKGIENG